MQNNVVESLDHWLDHGIIDGGTVIQAYQVQVKFYEIYNNR